MGVARVCRATRVAKDAQAAIDTAAELAGGRPGSFAVRARRRDKRFPVTSAELAIAIGSRIQRDFGNPVNLRIPTSPSASRPISPKCSSTSTAWPGRAGCRWA